MLERRAEIIVTINTGRVGERLLRRYLEAGATILRLNGAFVPVDGVGPAVGLVRRAVGDHARIFLDLPGYKVRFLHLNRQIRFRRDEPFTIRREWLNYPDAFDLLQPDALLRINEGHIVLTVVEVGQDVATCVATCPGVLTPGKGLHLDGASYRPSSTALSALDRELVRQSIAHGVDCVALSFAGCGEDVLHLRRLCKGSSVQVVPKIESKDSLKRLGEIIELAGEVIIDRGDLAGEIGLERVWGAQREIISACKRTGTRVYAATQVLASMIRFPLPTIAEIDSLHSLVHEGIDGIQLSDETSVGRHAVAAIRVVQSVFEDRARHAGPLRVVAGSTA